jgi:hypothetical protein
VGAEVIWLLKGVQPRQNSSIIGATGLPREHKVFAPSNVVAVQNRQALLFQLFFIKNSNVEFLSKTKTTSEESGNNDLALDLLALYLCTKQVRHSSHCH